SPNATLDAAEPTNGTSSANGTTCAAVERRNSGPHSQQPMLVEMPPIASMQEKPVSDICDSACQVAYGPSTNSVSANRGIAATRHSHENRSNIGTSLARRSNRLPTAKLIGQ